MYRYMSMTITPYSKKGGEPKEKRAKFGRKHETHENPSTSKGHNKL